MKIRQIGPFAFLALVLMACSLLSRSTASAPADQAETALIQDKQPAPTLPSTLSLHQAWDLAWPEIEAWAADAQPAQQWSCPGRLEADGTCNQWQGAVVSVHRVDLASIIVSRTGVKVQPSHSEIVGKPAIEAAISREGLINSPQAAQTAWDWLEGQVLRTEHTHLRGLTLRSGPGSLECGPAPAYVVSFDSPPGQLCLDAYTGAIIYSSYAR